jgi:hypothetical protein
MPTAPDYLTALRADKRRKDPRLRGNIPGNIQIV